MDTRVRVYYKLTLWAWRLRWANKFIYELKTTFPPAHEFEHGQCPFNNDFTQYARKFSDAQSSPTWANVSQYAHHIINVFITNKELNEGTFLKRKSNVHMSHFTKKSVFGGLQPGRTQNSLLSECTDWSVQLCRLICTFVVCIRQVFSWNGSYSVYSKNTKTWISFVKYRISSLLVFWNAISNTYHI